MSPAAPSSKGGEVSDGGCRRVVDRFPETPYLFLPGGKGKRFESTPGFIQSWILEKVLKFAQQFFRPGKSLENRDKVWKNSKKSEFFPRGQIPFNLAHAKTFNHRMRISFIILYVRIAPWLPCICSASWKKFDSCVSLLTTYLLTLSLEKIKHCFGKSLEKVLNFGSKNLYEPCTPFLYHVGNKYQGKIIPKWHFLSVLFCVFSSRTCPICRHPLYSQPRE